ncbi:MAG TPA: hypothetical protein VFD43_06065, partial [Planctomycetota bacterium]|nr:hypothetical protein [Planctomycetota bacterium]
MWLGLALVVWLWGLALYLAVYSFAVWRWDALELHALLGQDFYNAHIPGGGWAAVWMPTLVFLLVLAIVAAAGRPLRAAAGRASARLRAPRRVVEAAATLALVGLAVPAV